MKKEISINCVVGMTVNCETIMESNEFKKAVEFHGHVCPGLAIGFRAAKAALDFFNENRSEDEEIVAIVENDACGVDAVQSLTGCTFGKGNLIFRDYGKQVFYFVSRKTGKAVRIALRADVPRSSPEHAELIRKVREEMATDEEKNQFMELHKKRTCQILETPLDILFSIKELEIKNQKKARIAPSVLCDRCGEPTMSIKLEDVNGKKICKECLSN